MKLSSLRKKNQKRKLSKFPYFVPDTKIPDYRMLFLLYYRINEVLAECEEDESDSDEEENKSKKTTKLKKNVYLKEDEDTIIDFSAPSAYNSMSGK